MEARGTWAYIFWTMVFVLGAAIVSYGESYFISILEVLFALLISYPSRVFGAYLALDLVV